jgi:hypothetical protein
VTASLPCCYVHIGAPKTGSTTLQKLLFENRRILLERGVLYPDVSLRGYGHHDLAFLLSGEYPDWAIPQPRPLEALVDELGRIVAAHAGDILLSSENFYLFPAPEALRQMLEASGASAGRRTVIIVYARRQDEAHESWYNQTVKAQGATHGLSKSIVRWRGLWDYHARLAEWSAVFGSHNLIVRAYEEDSFAGGSLLEDFATVVGVSTEGLVWPTERANGGLNRDLLEFQRLFNRLPLKIREKRRFFRRLIELTELTAGTGRFDETPLLTCAQRRQIMTDYQAGNCDVARAFLGRETLFPPSTRGRSASRTERAELTLDKLTYTVRWLMTRRDAARTR